MSAAIIQPMVTGGTEVIIGMVQEPAFGPLVVLGLGTVATVVLATRQPGSSSSPRLRRPGIPRPGKNSPGLARPAIRFTVMPGELATGSGTRRCRSVPPSLAGPTVSVPPSLLPPRAGLAACPGKRERRPLARMRGAGQRASRRAVGRACRPPLYRDRRSLRSGHGVASCGRAQCRLRQTVQAIVSPQTLAASIMTPAPGGCWDQGALAHEPAIRHGRPTASL